MKKITERITYWGQLLLLPVYWFSFLFPRSKNIWLFGSTFGRRFADNPRYFYLYVSQMAKKNDMQDNPCMIDGNPIRPIWISRNKEIVEFLNDKGYESYYKHSLKGIWYCLRGKVYCFDNYSKDISFWLSGGAVKFNMWHGIPLKKIQADNIFDKVRHPESAWEKFKTFPRRLSDEKPSHYVLTTSEFMKPIFSSAFQTKKVSTIGYPRIDGFAFEEIRNIFTQTEQNALDKIKAAMHQSADSKMIYYMPTFRDSETSFFDVIDLQEFNNFLKVNHYVFCTKLHPKSKLRARFETIESENIIIIDADTDPYVFIPVSDMLVTDYSSIYFDYLFANKPIVFFDYDLEQYLKDSREMYFDYEEYTPGVKASTQEEFQQAIQSVLEDDMYATHRKELQEQIYDESKQAISSNLMNEIKGILGLI